MARIVAVVDVYDALGSNRTYKRAFPEDECLRIIREDAGSQFDPHIVSIFLQNIDAVRAIKKAWED